MFLICIQSFRDQIAESFRMYKATWMMNPTRSRDIPSYSVIDLAEIRPAVCQV
jgi:hypothetical protein